MYSFDDLNSVWMKPIKTYYIKPEEQKEINAISSVLIGEFRDNIHIFTNRIIYKELSKRPKANLHKQLLIKRQVISNVYENMTNITINMAKDRYDLNNFLNTTYQNEPELIIVDKTEQELIMEEQTDINCYNYDVNLNHSFYSFLDENDDSMQVDYLNNTNNTDYLYQPETCDDVLVMD